MSAAGITNPATANDPCAATNATTYQSLRIAAVFIILVTSLFGTMLPIALRRQSWIPKPIFEFAKFFGSGVIIATAFIHLLAPAFDALGSECLGQVYQDYHWAPAIAMMAVYAIFFAEIAAYRIGSRKMARLGLTYQTHSDAEAEHGHSHLEPLATGAPVPGAGEISPVSVSAPAAHDHAHADSAKAEKRDPDATSSSLDSLSVDEFGHDTYDHTTAEGVSQLIAVGVLEFGVILHSFIIGLTLAVNQDFITLFIVIIFHQMFEGLGLGSRLSQLRLPPNMGWSAYAAGALYSIMTPLGIAIGLGVRNSYNGNGATANAVSGILDAFSAGILLYTGLVELLGHEILLNPKMMKASSGKLAYVFVCMLLGSGLMALLGRWA